MQSAFNRMCLAYLHRGQHGPLLLLKQFLPIPSGTTAPATFLAYTVSCSVYGQYEVCTLHRAVGAVRRCGLHRVECCVQCTSCSEQRAGSRVQWEACALQSVVHMVQGARFNRLWREASFLQG